MRVEWIGHSPEKGGAGEQAIHAQLWQDLGSILPGTAEQRSMFIESAYEALDIYRKLFVPFVSDLEGREEKLNRLKNGVRAFSEAVDSLDEDTRDLIEQAQWAELGRMEFPEFARTVAAVDWALVTSNAAERLLSEIRKRKKITGGPRGDKALDALITEIAVAYAAIFSERPSSARDGTFAKSLREILSAGGIKPEWKRDEVDIERRLTRILKTVPAELAPNPRRGRRRKATQFRNHCKTSPKNRESRSI